MAITDNLDNVHILNVVDDDDDDDEENVYDDDDDDGEDVVDDDDDGDDDGKRHFLSDGRRHIRYHGNEGYTDGGNGRQEPPHGIDDEELFKNSSSDLRSGKDANGEQQPRAHPSRTLFVAPTRRNVSSSLLGARRKSHAGEAERHLPERKASSIGRRRQQSSTPNATFFNRYRPPSHSDRQGVKRRGSSSDRRSKLLGWFNNGSLKLSTIVWPGGSFVGPAARGPRILRVVTMAVDPFVMEQPDMGSCRTSTPCLRISAMDDERGSKVRGRISKGTGGTDRGGDEEAYRSVEEERRRNLLENIFEDFESGKNEFSKADLESR